MSGFEDTHGFHGALPLLLLLALLMAQGGMLQPLLAMLMQPAALLLMFIAVLGLRDGS